MRARWGRLGMSLLVGGAVGCGAGPTAPDNKPLGDSGEPAEDTPSEAPPEDSADPLDSGAPIDTADPVDTGDPVEEPEPVVIVQGAWAGQIKDYTDPSAGATCADGAWNSDQGAHTREALLDGGLDVWVGNLGTGAVTDCWWLNFQRVLAELDPADGITVAGGLDPSLDHETVAEAIVQLRLLAADEPELRAVVLDDFMGSVRRWDRPGRAYGPEEVAALQALAHDTACAEAHCSAPAIELWPYTTAKDVAFMAVPGLELGIRTCAGSCDTPEDHRLYPADGGLTADAFGASVAWTPDQDAPDATVRFLFNDRLSGRGGPVAELVVRRDGTELGRFALNDDQAAGTSGQPSAIRSVELPLALVADTPLAIELTIEASSEVVSEAEERLARVWGLEVWTDGEVEPIDLLAEATVEAVARRDVGRTGLSLDPAEVVQVESTGDGNITAWSDAVLVHDIEPSVRWFDLDVHRHVMDAACRSIRAAGVVCHAAQWGNDQWRVDLDPALQAARIDVARDTADGVIIYRHPIDLIGGQRDADGAFVPPDRGIYRSVEPTDAARFDIGATWPRYTRGVPGFRRRFEQVVSCAGDWTVEWSTFGGPRRFDLRIARAASGVEDDLYRGDVADTPTTGTTTVALDAGQAVVVELVGIASVGNAAYGFDARLVAPDVCGGAPAVAWTTSSHVDPELAAQFECVDAALKETEVAGCAL